MTTPNAVLQVLATNPALDVWSIAPLAGANVSTCQAMLNDLEAQGLVTQDAQHRHSVSDAAAEAITAALVAAMTPQMDEVREQEWLAIVAGFDPGTFRWSPGLPDDAFCRPGCSHEQQAITASAGWPAVLAPALSEQRKARLLKLLAGEA